MSLEKEYDLEPGVHILSEIEFRRMEMIILNMGKERELGLDLVSFLIVFLVEI